MKRTREIFAMCVLALAISAFSSCGVDDGMTRDSSDTRQTSEKAEIISDNQNISIEESVITTTEVVPVVKIVVPFQSDTTVVNEADMEEWVETNLLSTESGTIPTSEYADKSFSDLSAEQQQICERIYQIESNYFYAERLRAQLVGGHITTEEIKSLIAESDLQGEELGDYIFRQVCQINKYPDYSIGSGLSWDIYCINDESGDQYIISKDGEKIYYYHDPDTQVTYDVPLSKIDTIIE